MASYLYLSIFLSRGVFLPFHFSNWSIASLISLTRKRKKLITARSRLLVVLVDTGGFQVRLKWLNMSFV